MTPFCSRQAAVLTAICALPFLPVSAYADDLPTAREAGTFEAQAATPSELKKETILRLQAGGSLATGNTRSFAGNIAGRFVLRRMNHQFTTDGIVNYGYASVLPMGAAMRQNTTTAENYLLRARYDLFVTSRNGLLVSGQAFRDQPSGFNSRFSGQIGYVRDFIRVPQKRRFWGELAYDLTYENLTQPPTMDSTSNERVVHFARGFVGYEEHATKLLELTAGVEGLLNVVHPQDFRINGSVGFASKIADELSLALTVTLRYLHEPIPEHEPLDTVTLISIIYQHAFKSEEAPLIHTAPANTAPVVNETPPSTPPANTAPASQTPPSTPPANTAPANEAPANAAPN